MDCGGDCNACATCDDGIQNGNETGVDCGGDCNACATCDDGIQNGNETGVDCGGDCQPCNTGCNGTEVNLSITLDNYPQETSWTITDADGTTVGSGDSYGGQPSGSSVGDDLCLPDGCYTFTINDSYGDGICCAYGNGSYSLTDAAGNVLASGGSFGTTESTDFCLNDAPPAPTCNDGIQNGNETGVDCGGDCQPCNTGCADVNIDSEDFNVWGIWNDGGSDCRRSSNDAQYANSGNLCVRLRDNSGAASAMTTDNLNLTGFEEVTIDFNFLPVGMENGEDLWLRVSTDGGASYTTVATWARGTDFNNNQRQFESVTMTGNFTSNTRFRLQCDASVNNDRVYVDDVVLTGCTNGGTRTGGETETAEDTVIDESFRNEADLTPAVMKLNAFPNPTSEVLNVTYDVSKTADVEMIVTDLTGKVVSRTVAAGVEGTQTVRLRVSDFHPGIYMLQVISEDSRLMKKFVVVR